MASAHGRAGAATTAGTAPPAYLTRMPVGLVGNRTGMELRADRDLGAPIEDVAREAADATGLAYTNDAGIDVEEHLRVQLASRGLSADPATLDELAREIRSGHGVDLGEPDGSVS